MKKEAKNLKKIEKLVKGKNEGEDFENIDPTNFNLKKIKTVKA